MYQYQLSIKPAIKCLLFSLKRNILGICQRATRFPLQVLASLCCAVGFPLQSGLVFQPHSFLKTVQINRPQSYLIKCCLIIFISFSVSIAIAQINTGPLINDSQETDSSKSVSLFKECFTAGLNPANQFDVTKQEAQFYSSLDSLSAQHNFSNLKNLNKLNTYLTKNYFTKAVIKAIPQDALLGGRYNDISAVMLQSLALQHLGIDYIINDTKTGIRLNTIVNADTLLLSEEIATSTGNVAIRHFNNFKIILFRNGRLSKTNVNDDTFIDEHFLIDTIIQAHQLPALQYFNNGVKMFEAEQYSAALKKLEKAHQLYAVPYIEQWMKLVIGIALSDENANTDPMAECDFLLSFSDVNWDVDNIQQQVINVATVQAQQLAGEPEKVEGFLNCIEEGIDNKDLKNTIREKIYLVLAESYYANAQYQNAINNFKSLYARDSTAHHNYIKNSVIQSLYAINEDSVRVDSLLNYEQSFSFLKMDAELIKYKTYLLSTCVYDNFTNKNKAGGTNCLDKFRAAFPNNEDKTLNSQQISSAYAAAAQYYINNKEIETAKALIEEGKTYCGENETFDKLLKNLEAIKK